MNVEKLLADLGITIARKGHQASATCPMAAERHEGGEDANPSWWVVVDPGHPKHGQHHCWSCGFSGHVVSLAARIWGCKNHEVRQRLGMVLPENLASMSPDGMSTQLAAKLPGDELFVGVKPYVIDPSAAVIGRHPRSWPPAHRLYLHDRELQDVAVGHGLGYGIGQNLAGRLVIPIHTMGRLVSHTARAVDHWRRLVRLCELHGAPMPPARTPAAARAAYLSVERHLSGLVKEGLDDWSRWSRHPKSRYDSGHIEHGAQPALALYNHDLVFPPGAPIVVFEGAIKTLIATAAGVPNAVGICGAGAVSDEHLLLLNRLQPEAVAIATDPDEAGDQSAERISAGLCRRTRVLRARPPRAIDDLRRDQRRQFALDLRRELGWITA